MQLPPYADYQLALQHPHIAFGQDVDLRSCTVQTTTLGQPETRSGSFAYTYRLNGRGRQWAVRCFSKYVPDRDRCRSIAQFVQSHPQPFLVAPTYVDRGVLVKRQWYPIIKMPWVLGKTLSTYIDSHMGDRQRLAGLLRSFEAMVASLESLGVAHGDLQHGNILVRNGQLVLVDYDGTYVPGLARYEVKERGHRDYQHPARDKEFGPTLDRFSSIVIDLALRALLASPGLWQRYNNGDNLLFLQKDFLDPRGSRLLADLERLPDVGQHVASLRRICKADLASVPRLRDFLAGRVAADLPARAGSVSKWEHFKIIAATQRQALLSSVGERVTVVGRISSYAPKMSRAGKPYAFLSFGNWQLGSFRFIIWSEGLDAFQRQNRDLRSYQGKWVSVTGLLDEYRSSNGRHHPQMVIETPSEIEVLSSEEEARNRLTGKTSGHRTTSQTPTRRQVQTRKLTSVVPTTLSAEQHFQQGFDLHNNGKLDEAVREYLAALRLNPKLPWANHNLGIIYQAQSKVDAAIQAYESELRIQPNNADTHRQLGWLWVEKGRYDKSIRAFQTATKLNGTDGNAYFGLGNSYSQQGRYQKTCEAYEQAVRYEPTVGLFSALAWTYWQLGQADEAERICTQALNLDATNSYAVKLMADIQRHRQQQRDQYVLQDAEKYQQLGQLGKALQILTQAVERRPSWSEARVMLATIYEEAGNGVESYRQAEIAAKQGFQQARDLLAMWQPRLGVSPERVDFGDVFEGTAVSQRISVLNVGKGVLRGQVKATSSWLTVSPAAYQCGPGQAQVIMVSLRRDLKGGYHEDIHALEFTSNGGTSAVGSVAHVLGPRMVVDRDHLEILLDRDGRGLTQTTLRNTGGGTLNVRRGAARGADAIWLEPGNITCAAGKSAVLTVSMRKSAELTTLEQLRGEFDLESNSGSVELTWAARFAGPHLAITPSVIDLGVYSVGNPPSRALWIENLGSEELSGEVQVDAVWLEITQTKFSLPPFGSVELIFTVVPDAVELHIPKLSSLFKTVIRCVSNGGNIDVPIKLRSQYLNLLRLRRRKS